MDQLINQITQRTGISQDQAEQAVQVVANFLQDKLPGPIASQVQNLLGGQGGGMLGGKGLGGATDQAQQTLGGLGNLPTA